MIFEKASAGEIPEVANQYEQPEVRLLAALCRVLQRACGDGPFFLSARTAGELLNVPHVTAWRWLRLFQVDKLIELVSKGSQKKHKASRYRYIAPL